MPALFLQWLREHEAFAAVLRSDSLGENLPFFLDRGELFLQLSVFAFHISVELLGSFVHGGLLGVAESSLDYLSQSVCGVLGMGSEPALLEFLDQYVKIARKDRYKKQRLLFTHPEHHNRRFRRIHRSWMVSDSLVEIPSRNLYVLIFHLNQPHLHQTHPLSIALIQNEHFDPDYSNSGVVAVRVLRV